MNEISTTGQRHRNRCRYRFGHDGTAWDGPPGKAARSPHGVCSRFWIGRAERVGDLAIEQRVAQPTMTGLVIRMENDQLLQRQPDPDDGRASLVKLTDAGKEAVEAYRQRAIMALAGDISSFSAKEQEILAQAVPPRQRLNDQVASN